MSIVSFGKSMFQSAFTILQFSQNSVVVATAGKHVKVKNSLKIRV